MSRVVNSPEELGEVLVRDLERLGAKLRRVSRETAEWGAAELRRRAPQAFGELRRSIGVVEHKLGADIVIAAPYARWVEMGRRPGKAPPPQAMVKWVSLRQRQGRALVAGAKARTPRGTFATRGAMTQARAFAALADPEIRAAAFLIGRKIAEEGTPPRPFIRPTVPKIRRFFEARLREVLR